MLLSLLSLSLSGGDVVVGGMVHRCSLFCSLPLSVVIVDGGDVDVHCYC